MKAFVDKVTISYLPLQKSDSFLSAVLSAAVFYCDPSFCILIQWLREIFKFVRQYGCMDRRLRSNTDEVLNLDRLGQHQTDCPLSIPPFRFDQECPESHCPIVEDKIK
jgi:hypothetical protein